MSNTVFISYRWEDDNRPSAEDLYEKFQGDNNNWFLDKKKLHYDIPLTSSLKNDIKERDVFLCFVSTRSLERMLEYDENNINKKDYAYLELSYALTEGKRVICVCSDTNSNTEILESLARDVFCNKLGCSDAYPIIYRERNDKEFYSKIQREINRRNINIEGQSFNKVNIEYQNFNNIYWVGTRKSDMPNLGNRGFAGSISLFGDIEDENNLIMCSKNQDKRVDHNDSRDLSQDEFVELAIRRILEKNDKAQFLFYNPSTVHRLNLIDKYGEGHFICVNDKELLSEVNNKESFRQMINSMDLDETPLIPVLICTRFDCHYDDLLQKYRNGDFGSLGESEIEPEFIVQAPVASGGDGTFILNRENENVVLSALERNARYLVSVYYKHNIPINCHAIIYDNNNEKESIIICPGSIQLIKKVDSEHKLLYKGADFISYRKIPKKYRDVFAAMARKVAKQLQAKGYRGVCGIDAIIHNEQISLMEINGRFQASTELINRALQEQKGYIRKTIQELHFDAFSKKVPLAEEIIELESLSVDYSNYAYSYEGMSFHDKHIFNIATSSKTQKNVVKVQDDGYNSHYDGNIIEAYLYRIAFNKNICSINEDGGIWIHENLTTPDKWLVNKIKSREKLAVKICLMIQGIVLSDEIDVAVREATNNAIDLRIGDMVINAPTDIRFVEFTPFTLCKSNKIEGKYSIYYYDELLLEQIDIFEKDKLQGEILRDGKHSVSEIAYLSTDRLRVHTTNNCCFKQQNKSCKFCNIQPLENENEIKPSDVKEVVDKYIEDKKKIESHFSDASINEKPVVLRHFLLGGQSLESGSQRLIELSKILGQYYMPVYAMTLPLSKDTVTEMIKNGVYEFSYNIEIFNQKCREKYMPGKGKIPVAEYIERLVETEQLLQVYAPRYSAKAVRSMVIVGLEPYFDMLDGIKELVDKNIEPMLSVFRPLPGTELDDLNAPPIRLVYDLFNIISQYMYEKSMRAGADDFPKLGPKCFCCQNNTVSLPWKYQQAVRQTQPQRAIIAPYFEN